MVTGASGCTVCGEGPLAAFLDAGEVPAHVGVLWDDPDAARACARGKMTLALCRSCGWVHNTDFEPDVIDYSQAYDNTLHASPVFRAFERDLVDHLIARYDLHGATVAEIGCGSGRFLGLLTRATHGRGIGFDPSHDPNHVDPVARDTVTFVRGEYPGSDDPPRVDLLVCRQTLEHIPEPVGFLRGLRAALDGCDTVVYFDVPNSTMPFQNLSIWDLIYEHCSYFVDASLRYLFEVTGFEVLDVRETYEGQFLSLEARASTAPAPSPPGLAEVGWLVDATEDFANRFTERVASLQTRLDALRAAGASAVVWGGGARAVSFFNLLDVGAEVSAIVDMNPRKQGTFLSGTGHPITGADRLVELQPDVVIILNALYRAEITSSLTELGLAPEVIAA